jgi:propanol-preferring alcohol dehydrogenase
MSDIPSFRYADLWGERTISSVANLTRADGAEFLELATRIPVKAHTAPYSLQDANAALTAVRNGQLDGAAVLLP